MNWIFFLVFTSLGGVMTVGYFQPVSRRQFSIIFVGFLIGGLVGALKVPAEHTDSALLTVVLCFTSMPATFLWLERSAYLPLDDWTGGRHDNTGRVRRSTD